MDLEQIIRFPSLEVVIGNRPLGASNPIRLQSMTNTNTLDVAATVAQSIRIFEAGADYVRISAPNVEAANQLEVIRKKLQQAGFDQPLIADIHFNPEVALIAARYVEKIRINPGNYTSRPPKGKIDFTQDDVDQELEALAIKLGPLLETCRQHGTAIRIGTNLGSLSQRIIAQYGNTPTGMVVSTLEFLEVFSALDFHQVVVSLKASKPLIMIQAYEEMVKQMLDKKMNYPLHVGITEAGEGENGRIKSALGICTLMNKGIGDTLRVSLTEAPEYEIPFAQKISQQYQQQFTNKASNPNYQLKPLAVQPHLDGIMDRHLRAVVVCDFNASVSQSQDSHALKPDLVYSEACSMHPQREACLMSSDQSFCLPVWMDMPTGATPGIRWISAGKPLPPAQTDAINLIQMQEFDNPDQLDLLISELNARPEKVILAFEPNHQEHSDEQIIHLAIWLGSLLLEKKIQGVWLRGSEVRQAQVDMLFGFLQSSGLRITRTEFISCPTCARTSFNLEKVLHDIKAQTAHLPGLKIAVMGCVVNGPGEMADADFGYVGAGNGKLHLYKGQTPIQKNIRADEAADRMLEVLRTEGLL